MKRPQTYSAVNLLAETIALELLKSALPRDPEEAVFAGWGTSSQKTGKYDISVNCLMTSRMSKYRQMYRQFCRLVRRQAGFPSRFEYRVVP